MTNRTSHEEPLDAYSRAADGRTVTGVGDLQNIVAGHRPVERVQLSFLRGERLRQVTVILSHWPAPAEV